MQLAIAVLFLGACTGCVNLGSIFEPNGMTDKTVHIFLATLMHSLSSFFLVIMRQAVSLAESVVLCKATLVLSFAIIAAEGT